METNETDDDVQITIRLTPRQREILLMREQGLKHQEIADKLGISRHTVDSHIRDCVSLLHTSGGYGAVHEARKRGLIP